jgi:hypothetical protein
MAKTERQQMRAEFLWEYCFGNDLLEEPCDIRETSFEDRKCTELAQDGS